MSGSAERENIVHQAGSSIVALDYFEEKVSFVSFSLLDNFVASLV